MRGCGELPARRQTRRTGLTQHAAGQVQPVCAKFFRKRDIAGDEKADPARYGRCAQFGAERRAVWRVIIAKDYAGILGQALDHLAGRRNALAICHEDQRKAPARTRCSCVEMTGGLR